MDKNFVLLGFLASILIVGVFGVFSIQDSFADDNEDSEKNEKQLEKIEEEKKEQEEQKERDETAEEKQREREEKAEERQKELEEERKELEERQRELNEKKLKLESDRKRLEEKLLEKANEYEDKLKEKFHEKIESGYLDDPEQFKVATSKLENKLSEKSEEIREKLLEKSEKLDSRTQKILDKINDDNYLGEKIGSSDIYETYELTFGSVDATSISDKTQVSSMTGMMSFSTFDKGKSNLKLELKECEITVDDVTYHCGFGKARTVSSGDSGAKDSLVILAFLEHDVLKDLHSTLKIFLNADSTIAEIDGTSNVSILGPHSKISHMWFLDGTGTLTKTTSDSTDDSTDDIDLSEN